MPGEKGTKSSKFLPEDSLSRQSNPTIKVYQVPELQIIEHLDISLLCLFLLPVQLPPETINGCHIQHLACIYLPGVATKRANIISSSYRGTDAEFCD